MGILQHLFPAGKYKNDSLNPLAHLFPASRTLLFTPDARNSFNIYFHIYKKTLFSPSEEKICPHISKGYSIKNM